MKRIFALVLSFVFLLSCLVLPAGAMFDPSPVYQMQAASAYIVNTDTNIIVYDKDSTKQVSAGGLTKYMTLAVLLTNYADQLDSTFQMPFAISDYVYNTNNADMRSNETFTYREAMYAMLTRNANEAAMGVAYTLAGGDLDGWVAQMNTLSQRIGTTASSWTDACGIDSGNTTCAVDMYLILRYLMSFDAFVEVSGAPSFTMPAKEKHRSSSVLVSQNAALSKASGGSYYRSAMQGMCNVTAFKNDTGTQSYVSWGNKDGATYIFCVMDSPDSCDTLGYANRRPALFETVELMDWVFDSFSIQAALDTDLTIAEIPVKYSSDTDTLQLYPNDSMMTLLPSTSDGTVTQKYFHLPDYAAGLLSRQDIARRGNDYLNQVRPKHLPPTDRVRVILALHLLQNPQHHAVIIVENAVFDRQICAVILQVQHIMPQKRPEIAAVKQAFIQQLRQKKAIYDAQIAAGAPVLCGQFTGS